MAEVQVTFLPTLADPSRSSRSPYPVSTTHAVAEGLLNRVHSSLDFQASGRPVAAGSHLDVGISHSHGLGVIAVARSTLVGIDLECGEWSFDERFVRKTCTERETEFALAGTSMNERLKLLWTRKEACLKLWGVGLRTPTAEVEVLRRRVDAPRGYSVDPVYVRSWVQDRMVLSLASSSPDVSVQAALVEGEVDGASR